MSSYEIRVQGHLDQRWSAWLEGLTIRYKEDGTTLLHGHLADEAALYGVLMKLRDLGVPLLAVRRMGAEEKEGGAAG